MVSSEYGNPILVSDFQGHQQGDRLHAVIASVHIVPHEEVVGLRAVPPNPEQLQKVLELAVYVPAHSHRAPDRLHVALLSQDLSSFVAQRLHLALAQRHALDQLLDLRVQLGDHLVQASFVHSHPFSRPFPAPPRCG